MGSFYGLEIAKTGLFISSKSLEVTGHNISNANTIGYTRQRIVTQAIDPAAQNSRYLNVHKGTMGAGVDIQVLDQIRDSFLDSEFRRENADLMKWNTRTDTLEYIESLMNESTDNSISSTLADFFNSLAELSKDPVNKEIRTNVQQNALKMTETLNHYYEQFLELQKVQNDSMKITVDRINQLTTSIADFNKQIYGYELSGERANDLRDKRNVLLDELSGLVNIDYYENSDGQLVVSVEGQELVNHTTATQLTATADQPSIVTGQTDFYSISYGAAAFKYSSGKLEAYRQMRDGNAVDDIGIPRIIDNLNTLARSLAKEINAIHSTGYTVPYNAVASHTNVNFFDVPSNDYTLVTAENFALSSDVLDNVANIAASSVEVDLSDPNDQRGNNIRALELVALTSSNEVPVVTNFENYLKSAIVEVALESAHSQKMDESQQSVVSNLNNRKESVSGVSIDEEMIQMVKFQHAYSAASRMITTIDEMLDILINRTGSVGR